MHASSSPEPTKSHRSRRRWVPRTFVQKAVFAALCLGILYLLGGFLLLPWILKHQLRSQLSETTGRAVSVGSVRFNPLVFSLSIEQFALAAEEAAGSGEADLLRFDQLIVDLSVTSLWHRAPVVERLRLDGPAVTVVRNRDGVMSFQDILDRIERDATEEDDDEPDELPRFRVHRLEIRNGSLVMTDHAVADEFSYEATPIDLTLLAFGTLGEAENEVSLEALTPQGTSFSWRGTLVLSPFSSEGEFRIGALRFEPFRPYLESFIAVEFGTSQLSLALPYRFNTNPQGELLEIVAGEVLLESLEAAEPGAEQSFFALDAIGINGISAQLTAQSVHIEEIAIRDGRLLLERDEDGQLRLAERLPPQEDDPRPAPAEPGSADNEWQYRIDRLHAQNLSFLVRDESFGALMELPLTIAHLRLENISEALDQPVPFHLEGTVGEAGSYLTEGTVSPLPLRASLTLSLQEIALSTANPVAAALSGIHDMKGSLSIEGAVQIRPGEENPTDVSARFQGTLSVDELALATSAESDPILQLGRLGIDGMDAQLTPFTVSIEALSMESPSALIERSEDGMLNWLTLLEPPAEESIAPAGEGPETAAAPEPESGAEEPGIHLTVSQATLRDGTIVFEDRMVAPAVRQTFSDFEVTVNAFSLDGTTPGGLHAQGTIDQAATFAADANWEGGDFRQNTTIKVALEAFRLPSLSPYSAHFIGRSIAEGRLALDLNVAIEESRLAGNQRLTLAEFELGPGSGEPPVLDLPIGLAVSVLKDREGTIALNVPVSGDITDPQFSIAGIIQAALGNVIRNAATAPFRMLGSIFGGGGDRADIDLSFITFAPGLATLDGENEEKLRTLARALYERPELRLTYTGHVDPTTDRAALARSRLREQLEQSHRESGQAEAPGGEERDSRQPFDYEGAVTTAYLAQTGTPPETETISAIPPPAPQAQPEAATEAGTAARAESDTTLLPTGNVVSRITKRRGTRSSTPVTEAGERPPSVTPPATPPASPEPGDDRATVTPLPPLEAMEDALLAMIEVHPVDLDALATRREEAARRFILEAEPIDPERLSPDPADGTRGEAPPASVSFELH